jgi:hypothetical protein
MYEVGGGGGPISACCAGRRATQRQKNERERKALGEGELYHADGMGWLLGSDNCREKMRLPYSKKTSRAGAIRSRARCVRMDERLTAQIAPGEGGNFTLRIFHKG